MAPDFPSSPWLAELFGTWEVVLTLWVVLILPAARGWHVW